MNRSSKEKNHYFGNMYQRFLSLNFFVRNPPSTEKQLENQEKYATRIYILLFLLSMFVAFFYYGPFNEETKLIKLENPSIDLVNNLHTKSLSSLSCPCSKVAIPYSKFLSIESEFNSICSSEFVSPLYRLNLLEKNDSISLALVTHYRMLSSLCNLSNQFIKNAEKVFYNRELITVETLTNSTFEIKIKSFIFNFIRQTKSDYRRIFSFIINSFRVNQLLNLFTKNWKIDFTNENENYLIKTIPHRFSSSNCTCAIQSNCSEPLIDNIRIGCLPYDGFRLSKLNNISYGILNHHLFVEKWINYTNYTNYFQTCQPLECQYILPDRNNPILMLTTLLGLYGGEVLIFILRKYLNEFLFRFNLFFTFHCWTIFTGLSMVESKK